MTALKQLKIRERTHLIELESAVGQQQAAQERIIEDILRSNAYAVDSDTETTLRLKKLQTMYEEVIVQKQELIEKLE